MNRKNNTLFDLRASSLSLLALAVKQLFPGVLLAGGRVTSLGFYYDFVFPVSFEESFLLQIEELMLAWIRQKMEVDVKEMVASSARAYFQFHKEPYLVRQIERSSQGSFFLMQIANKMVLSESSLGVSHLGEIGAFRLQKSEKLGKRLRIYGTAFFEKKDLKEFLKQSKEWTVTSHVVVGKEKGLFEEEGEGSWLWFAKGQKMRSLLINALEEEGEQSGYVSVFSAPVSKGLLGKEVFQAHQKIFEKLNSLQVARFFECSTFLDLKDKDFSCGLLDLSTFQGHRFSVFCEEKDLLRELISSLHFMTKIFKILDFEFRVVFLQRRKRGVQEELLKNALSHLGWEFEIEEAPSGEASRIECCSIDGLGRRWPVSFVSGPVFLSQDGFTCFSGSASLSFERSLALMLEKKKGEIPFWLVLEQVRVLPLQDKHLVYSQEVFLSLKEAGFRVCLDEGREELKTRLHKASQEGVAYVVIIGDQEVESLSVTLRDVGKKQTQSLSVQGLLDLLKKVI